jgi:uncharacterized protein (DUF2252 family)
MAEGRALRKKVPRSVHAVWKPPANRRDPLALIRANDRNRLPHLLPLRYWRMTASPFAFMRGSPVLMAADLAHTPVSGIKVQICGDCHLANFGAFASPERRILFDVTDFDETVPGPWEFDLKRLATSFTLLARCKQYKRSEARRITRAVVASYRQHLREFSEMSPLEIWYFIIDSELLIRTAPDPATRRRRERFELKARTRSVNSLLGKLLVRRGGAWKFDETPPTIVRLRPGTELARSFLSALERYPRTLSEDRRRLFAHYQLADLAFKVVGVGSVGTRCAAALYLSEGGAPLVLQVKQALPSVHERCSERNGFSHQGERIVVGQRLMQCASDIFLGWASDDNGHDFYIRQLRDMKTSVALDHLEGPVFYNFAGMCGWALARAHAKNGSAARLCGYIGQSSRLDEAIVQFAQAYADQCEADYQVFMRAVHAKKIPIQREKPPRQ